MACEGGLGGARRGTREKIEGYQRASTGRLLMRGGAVPGSPAAAARAAYGPGQCQLGRGEARRAASAHLRALERREGSALRLAHAGWLHKVCVRPREVRFARKYCRQISGVPRASYLEVQQDWQLAAICTRPSGFRPANSLSG